MVTTLVPERFEYTCAYDDGLFATEELCPSHRRIFVKVNAVLSPLKVANAEPDLLRYGNVPLGFASAESVTSQVGSFHVQFVLQLHP
jgi:hypothetical protein